MTVLPFSENSSLISFTDNWYTDNSTHPPYKVNTLELSFQ